MKKPSKLNGRAKSNGAGAAKEEEKVERSCVLRVSEAGDTIVRKYAEARGISAGEAADKLLAVASSRLSALTKYSKTHKPEKKEKKPRAAKKSAAAKKGGRKRSKAPSAEAPASAEA